MSSRKESQESPFPGWTYKGDKEGGANRPGEHGGKYTDGKRTALIKQDVNEDGVRADKVIAEAVVGSMVRRFAKYLGYDTTLFADVSLVTVGEGEKLAKSDPTGASTYLKSVFIPNYTSDLWVYAYDKFSQEKTPSSRPSGLGGLVPTSVSDITSRALLASPGLLADFCDSTGLRLLNADFGTHAGNYGIAPINDEPRLASFDYGAGSNNLQAQFDPYSSLANMGISQVHKNHFLEYSDEVKKSVQMGASFLLDGSIPKEVIKEIAWDVMQNQLQLAERYNNPDNTPGDALQKFGKRIGMSAKDIAEVKDSHELLGHVVNFYSQRLIQRQESQLAAGCEILLKACVKNGQFDLPTFRALPIPEGRREKVADAMLNHLHNHAVELQQIANFPSTLCISAQAQLAKYKAIQINTSATESFSDKPNKPVTPSTKRNQYTKEIDRLFTKKISDEQPTTGYVSASDLRMLRVTKLIAVAIGKHPQSDYNITGVNRAMSRLFKTHADKISQNEWAQMAMLPREFSDYILKNLDKEPSLRDYHRNLLDMVNAHSLIEQAKQGIFDTTPSEKSTTEEPGHYVSLATSPSIKLIELLQISAGNAVSAEIFAKRAKDVLAGIFKNDQTLLTDNILKDIAGASGTVYNQAKAIMMENGHHELADKLTKIHQTLEIDVGKSDSIKTQDNPYDATIERFKQADEKPLHKEGYYDLSHRIFSLMNLLDLATSKDNEAKTAALASLGTILGKQSNNISETEWKAISQFPAKLIKPALDVLHELNRDDLVQKISATNVTAKVEQQGVREPITRARSNAIGTPPSTASNIEQQSVKEPVTRARSNAIGTIHSTASVDPADSHSNSLRSSSTGSSMSGEDPGSDRPRSQNREPSVAEATIKQIENFVSSESAQNYWEKQPKSEQIVKMREILAKDIDADDKKQLLNDLLSNVQQPQAGSTSQVSSRMFSKAPKGANEFYSDVAKLLNDETSNASKAKIIYKWSAAIPEKEEKEALQPPTPTDPERP